MKDSKGITLTSLIITVIILIILTGVTTFFGTEVIDYTEENKFVTELKIIQEKVNIINEEISLGSTTYNNVGKTISSISAEQQETVNSVCTYLGMTASQLVNYKYFDRAELEKIGIDRIDDNVLISFQDRKIISTTGVEIDNTMYYTLDDINNK